MGDPILYAPITGDYAHGPLVAANDCALLAEMQNIELDNLARPQALYLRGYTAPLVGGIVNQIEFVEQMLRRTNITSFRAIGIDAGTALDGSNYYTLDLERSSDGVTYQSSFASLVIVAGLTLYTDTTSTEMPAGHWLRVRATSTGAPVAVQHVCIYGQEDHT